jgi:hypothetical protein
MRSSLTLALLATIVLVGAPAVADVGPVPPCPNGTHHEYLYGRRCVREGYHLEKGPEGGVIEVADAPRPAPTPTANPTTATPSPTENPGPTPAPTEIASPPGPATATIAVAPAPTATAEPPVVPSAPEPAPPSSRGCACAVVGPAGGLAASLGALAALLALARRRHARRR